MKRTTELRKTHVPVFQNQGRVGDVNYCVGCKGQNGTLINLYPCEVVELLDIIDQVRQIAVVRFDDNYQVAEIRDLLK